MKNRNFALALLACSAINLIVHYLPSIVDRHRAFSQRSKTKALTIPKERPSISYYNMHLVTQTRFLFIGGGFGQSHLKILQHLIKSRLPSQNLISCADVNDNHLTYLTEFLHFTHDMLHSSNDVNRSKRADKTIRDIKLAGLDKSKLDMASRMHVHSIITCDYNSTATKNLYLLDNEVLLGNMVYLRQLFPNSRFVHVRRADSELLEEMRRINEIENAAHPGLAWARHDTSRVQLVREDYETARSECDAAGEAVCLSLDQTSLLSLDKIGGNQTSKDAIDKKLKFLFNY
jgi:hypothetical protein